MTIGIIDQADRHRLRTDACSRRVEAIISNSRGPDSLKELVRELAPSIKPDGREEAARGRTSYWWRSTGQNCRRPWRGFQIGNGRMS